MSQTATKIADRASRKGAKRQAKKDQIADSAFRALRQLGYANTALRDIAEHSDLSLGMLHYYFEDKTELIIYCVRKYKDEFVRDIQTALRGANDANEMAMAFADSLANAVADNWQAHRMWYDIQNQSMFDTSFKPAVSEIEENMIGLVSAAAQYLNPNIEIRIAYAALDGLFRHFTQQSADGNPPAHADMKAAFAGLISRFSA